MPINCNASQRRLPQHVHGRRHTYGDVIVIKPIEDLILVVHGPVESCICRRVEGDEQ